MMKKKLYTDKIYLQMNMVLTTYLKKLAKMKQNKMCVYILI